MGTTYGTTDGPGDHLWQPYLVQGDHPQQHILQRMVWGTICGMTDISHNSRKLGLHRQSPLYNIVHAATLQLVIDYTSIAIILQTQ